MSRIVKSSLEMLSNPACRTKMLRQVEGREQKIVELGVCDVDCQWFDAAGREAEARRVMAKIAEIEQELETL